MRISKCVRLWRSWLQSSSADCVFSTIFFEQVSIWGGGGRELNKSLILAGSEILSFILGLFFSGDREVGVDELSEDDNSLTCVCRLFL